MGIVTRQMQIKQDQEQRKRDQSVFPKGVTGKALPGKSLYVDLVPSTAWYSNLRSMLQDFEWNTIRKLTYHQAKMRCQICGGHGPRHPVECHERWAFDTDTRMQRLTHLEALCPACHRTTHMGLAMVLGMEQEACEHMMLVNNWSEEQVEDHVSEAFKVWERRNRFSWDLDISHILTLGITLSDDTHSKILTGADAREFSRPVINT